MNHAFERLLKRIDDEFNLVVLPQHVLLAKGHAARLLADAGQVDLAAQVVAAPIEKENQS